MSNYPGPLHHDPLAPLLAAGSRALLYSVHHDLLGDQSTPVEDLWEIPEVQRILARQQPDGRWQYPGSNSAVRSRANYDQLETYRQLGVLVYKYRLDRRHPAIIRTARFLSSFQTDAGDYRGIYGNQYTPNYSAAITELLIKAGYAESCQVEQTMRWLLDLRQDDGGWAIPTRTLGLNLAPMLSESETREPDRSRPSSHLITGIVLRAFAAHPRYRYSDGARRAGAWLKGRFFSRDTYPDHVARSYWLVFSYPFWWTDLLSSLDSLTNLGFHSEDPDIRRGVTWFVEHQDANGLWNTGRNRPKRHDSDLWVALAVCRVFLRALGRQAISTSRPGPVRARTLSPQGSERGSR